MYGHLVKAFQQEKWTTLRQKVGSYYREVEGRTERQTLEGKQQFGDKQVNNVSFLFMRHKSSEFLFAPIFIL